MGGRDRHSLIVKDVSFVSTIMSFVPLTTNAKRDGQQITKRKIK
jgi:predicted rRNA methylase YqxC with S4 and FtsJ domains